MSGQANAAIGGIILAAGGLTTLAAFTAAAPGGDVWFAYPALLAGAMQLVTGLTQMNDEAIAEPAAAAAADARLVSGEIGADDYPPAAIRAGRQGKVTIGFTVTARGGIEDAHVESSSGSSVLDRAARRLIAERFRFDPARNAAGTPIAQTLRRTVIWRMLRD